MKTAVLSLYLTLLAGLVSACTEPSVEKQVSSRMSVPAAAVEGGGDGVAIPPKPLRIGVTPENVTLAAGTTVSYSATGYYNYGIVRDLTPFVTWSSSEPTVLAFKDAATPTVAMGGGAGTATVTATFKEVAGTASATVNGASLRSLTIEPKEPKITAAQTADGLVAAPFPLRAVGVYSDASTQDLTRDVTWTAADPTIGVFDDAIKGNLEVGKLGRLKITAELSGLRAETEALIEAAPVKLVSLKMKPDPVFLPIGGTTKLTVTGHYSDGTTQDLSQKGTWTSADPTIASVAGGGGADVVVTAVARGTTTMKTVIDGIEAAVSIAATSAQVATIEVSPPGLAMPKGTKQKMIATAVMTDGARVDVSSGSQWKSSEPSIIAVDASPENIGMAEAKTMGAAKITATYQDVTGEASLTVSDALLQQVVVTPTTASIAKGKKQKYTAVGRYSDGTSVDLTETAVWTSGNNSLATVDNGTGNRGEVTAVGTGTTSLRASVGLVAASVQLTLTAAEIVSLDITATSSTVPLGYSRQHRAIAEYTDGTSGDVTEAATWTFDILSTGYNYAAYVQNTAGNKGMVRSVAEGKTKIIATHAGKTAEKDFTVTEKQILLVDITPAASLLTLGQTVQKVATLTYTDNTTRVVTSLTGDPDLTVTWSVTNGTAVTVDDTTSKGLVTSVVEGNAQVRVNVVSVKFGAFADFAGVGVQSQCDMGGKRYDYYCWYLGGFNESCDTVCSNHGASYHNATSFFIGSAGLPSECRTVLNTLDANFTTLDTQAGTQPGGLGLGCGAVNFLGDDLTARFATPATNSTDADPDFRRACACTH